jgi:cobalt-zinc-cadmium efflux system outer membrane protein
VAIVEARARHARAEIASAARRAAVRAEVEGARAAYAAAVSAADRLEATALPNAGTIAAMAAEAYRAGKIDLAALLVIRRDALETRREHADRLLDAALAGVDLAVAVGAVP